MDTGFMTHLMPVPEGHPANIVCLQRSMMPIVVPKEMQGLFLMLRAKFEAGESAALAPARFERLRGQLQSGP